MLAGTVGDDTWLNTWDKTASDFEADEGQVGWATICDDTILNWLEDERVRRRTSVVHDCSSGILRKARIS